MQPNDTPEWQSFWQRLLREYERVCEELDREPEHPPPPRDDEPST